MTPFCEPLPVSPCGLMCHGMGCVISWQRTACHLPCCAPGKRPQKNRSLCCPRHQSTGGSMCPLWRGCNGGCWWVSDPSATWMRLCELSAGRGNCNRQTRLGSGAPASSDQEGCVPARRYSCALKFSDNVLRSVRIVLNTAYFFRWKCACKVKLWHWPGSNERGSDERIHLLNVKIPQLPNEHGSSLLSSWKLFFINY